MSNTAIQITGSNMVMASIKRSIEVRFVKEGVHRYPAAETDPKLATGGWDDVSFLAHPHMHYFHFAVHLEVQHNDRDVEFIQFSRWLQRQYERGTLHVDHKSCEMLAEDLINIIAEKHPGRWIKVSVFEDNINGAHVEYTPVKSDTFGS